MELVSYSGVAFVAPHSVFLSSQQQEAQSAQRGMSSWDRLSSQEYVTGLPLSKLVPELSFPASIEEIQVSALYGLLTCNVELTLLFEPSISDRRAARGVLNSLLEGTNATGSIEERLAPCAMTTELLSG